MQASSSAWRTPCHVDRNPSNGSVGFVAVIAWMTSSRALGRREKETSRDICGAMRAGTSLGLATAAVEHTSFKTAAVTIVLEKNPWSHTQPTAQDLQFFFSLSACSRSSFHLLYLLGQRCTWHLHPHQILAFTSAALGLVPPPSERSLLLGGRRSRLRGRSGEGSDS